MLSFWFHLMMLLFIFIVDVCVCVCCVCLPVFQLVTLPAHFCFPGLVLWPISFISFSSTIESAKGLKIIHINIRSLAPKIDLLRAWVTLYQPQVISISETWLHNNINNDEIRIDNYNLYRSDRASRGGGVVTYVSVNLLSECATPTVDPVNFESLFVNIMLHDNKHLTIGTIYRPPSAPSDSANCILF